MSLKNLIALQAQKKSAETPAEVAPVAEQPVEAESQKLPTAVPAAPVAKPKGLGLNTAAGFKKPTAPAKPKPQAAVESDVFSLEDLAGMSASVVEVPESESSGFDDEIEATAPDRLLPPDLSAEQLAFVESLDGIYGVLHDAEMFGQTVRIIMMELQENPEYEKLLSDSDVHTMVGGMRRTMGLARVKKQEKSRKTGTNKNARKKAGVSDNAMALLNSLMGGDDD